MAGAGTGLSISHFDSPRSEGGRNQDKLDQERNLIKSDHDDASRQNLIMPTYIFAVEGT